MLSVNNCSVAQQAAPAQFYQEKGPLNHNAKQATENRGDVTASKIRLNISGKIFETYMKTLQSKHGSIFRLMEVDKYYVHDKQEFFFDRNSAAFESILVYLQTGYLETPEKVPYKVFIEELQYFGFHKIALKLFNESIKGNIIEEKQVVDFSMQDYVWNLFEKPDFNTFSRIISGFTTSVIFISIAVFCIETLPSMKSPKSKVILSGIEIFCVIWFTMELAIRFACSRQKLRFFFGFMNLIDLISILPFYIGLIMDSSLSIFRVLRMVRLLRIFKLYRYSKAIHLIIVTIQNSTRGLLFLCLFIVVLVLLFSSIIYFFESAGGKNETPFRSIPHAFWICIVTLTTVGYGDQTPVTLGGKVITGLLTITGVIMVALPIPVVASNFMRNYKYMMTDSPAYRFDYDMNKSNHLLMKIDGEERETRC